VCRIERMYDAGSEFRAVDHPIGQQRAADIALLRLGNMPANDVQSLLVSPRRPSAGRFSLAPFG
jgi:hypothetical protein